MDNIRISIRVEEATATVPIDNSKLVTDDLYFCNICRYPMEILEINDKENTLTFKYLNKNENKAEQTMQVSEYLDLMKKFSYFYCECSLCNKKKNELENLIFLYCIKCDKIICSDCIDKHLKTNKKNHPDSNTEYIIKNNEKNIKCLLHPKEKNLAYCLKCNVHICKECMKSKKHINHTKNNIYEVLVTNEIKNILNNIINIYKGKDRELNKEKEKDEKELFNKKEEIKQEIKEQKKDKIKEVNKKLKKELIENEKLLNDKLNKLKIKYENEVKLYKNNFNISNEEINKKYEKLIDNYNKIFNEKLDIVEKKYSSIVSKLEINKKINKNKSLILIHQLLKNVQTNYPENYYNNNNINNVIFKYYENEDKNIKQILTKDVYNELNNKEKQKQKYTKEIKEIEELKNNKKINNENNNETENIKILGKEFVENNKRNFILFVNDKEYNIREYIEYDKKKFNSTKNEDSLAIILTSINNVKIIDLSYMFYE